MTIHSTRKARDFLISVATLFVISTSSHAGEQGPVYTMTVVEDSSHGRMVTAGEYRRAIDTIASKSNRRTSRFEVRTSLCVAYTKLGNLTNAVDACGDAVDIARRRMTNTASVTYTAIARTQLALALSNRGVMNAALGDKALAQRDFEDAGKLRTSLSAPQINLARLDAAEVSGT